MKQIEVYAASFGIQPTTVIQRGGGMSGSKWAAWLNGASCSMRTADKIRQYMADNPPKNRNQNEAA
ncbi:MAG: hypothetical protein COA53_06530 [Rhodobacteraceae bacterium]|nr:MAG: hypothetical protein COA53_06530 [Paracoccaceae bacterium]